MFRQYSKAAQYYIYLSDVSARGSGWELAFRKSRQFTRGQTLQELLTPKSVEFFSREGKRLGDKYSLDGQIREIIGIPIDTLQGKSLSSFSVSIRISQARTRETKREEDKAYSLIGIFSVYISLIYSEGETEAFERLQSEIIKRDSQQEKLLQDKNQYIEQIYIFSTTNFLIGLILVPLQARTSLGLSSILFL